MTDQTPTDQTRREIDVAEIRRHFGAIVSAVGQTQGLLLKVISNMQDISEGSVPEIPLSDLAESWEKAASTLQEAADFVFDDGNFPDTGHV